MSSGRDKYTYDSENVELPYRAIDVYEKQLSVTSSTASSPATSPAKGVQFLHPSSPQHPSHPINQHLLSLRSTHLSPQDSSVTKRSQSQMGNHSHQFDNTLSPGDASESTPHLEVTGEEARG